MYVAAILFAVVILIGNLYYYCHPLLRTVSLTVEPLDYLMVKLHRGGVFSNPLKTKGTAMLILALCSVIRSGKGRRVDPGLLVGVGLSASALYLIPFTNPLLYLIGTLTGGTALVWTFAMVGRIFSGFHEHGAQQLLLRDDGEAYGHDNVRVISPLRCDPVTGIDGNKHSPSHNEKP